MCVTAVCVCDGGVCVCVRRQCVCVTAVCVIAAANPDAAAPILRNDATNTSGQTESELNG